MSDHENEEWYRREYDPRPLPDLTTDTEHTPRELFAMAFGPCSDEQWQWLKELIARSMLEQVAEAIAKQEIMTPNQIKDHM